MKSKRISPARPLFWGQPWDMDTKMVHSMGDAFSDIYTFTAYENEMGELFLAEWLLIWDFFYLLVTSGSDLFIWSFEPDPPTATFLWDGLKGGWCALGPV